MAGRKPKPKGLSDLQGNPGKRTKNAEPKPPPGMPELPEHLDDEARAEWQRVATMLHELGLLTVMDRAAFAAYCQTWSRWVAAERALREQGPIILAPSGYPIQNPHLAIVNQCLKTMRGLLAEFGLTPSSRTRVAPVTKKEEVDELDGIA